MLTMICVVRCVNDNSIVFPHLSSSAQVSAGGDNDRSSRNEATLSHFLLEFSPGWDKNLTAFRDDGRDWRAQIRKSGGREWVY